MNNLYSIINAIQDAATTNTLVYEFGNGDVYEILNSGQHKYPAIILTVHSTTEISDDVNSVKITLFYVDRLQDNNCNKVQIQSISETILKQIIRKVEESNVGVSFEDKTFTYFEEKFADLCAGCFLETNVEYPNDIICDGTFEPQTLTITENGRYNVGSYDFANVSVSGDTPQWGNITGDLQEQTDLIDYIDSKHKKVILKVTNNTTTKVIFNHTPIISNSSVSFTLNKGCLYLLDCGQDLTINDILSVNCDIPFIEDNFRCGFVKVNDDDELVINENQPVTQYKYTKVTDLSEIEDNQDILIVCDEYLELTPLPHTPAINTTLNDTVINSNGNFIEVSNYVDGNHDIISNRLVELLSFNLQHIEDNKYYIISNNDGRYLGMNTQSANLHLNTTHYKNTIETYNDRIVIRSETGYILKHRHNDETISEDDRFSYYSQSSTSVQYHYISIYKKVEVIQ